MPLGILTDEINDLSAPMIHVVPQQVPVQLGTTININGNPIMAYQHAPLNMTAVGYGEPQMGHSLGAEDVMGGPMQGIAFIPV